MTWVHLTQRSKNSKVGPIKVTTTERKSCPKECGIIDECYASTGFHMNMHWKKVSKHERGDNWTGFTRRVKRFEFDEVWRHNQAGDLPKKRQSTVKVDRLDDKKCKSLAVAAKHTKGWTYTHYDPTDKHNAGVIKGMNKIGGLVVNLSADTLDKADEYYNLGIAPVTVPLPSDAPHQGNVTPNGLPIVVCPAQTTKGIQCATCKLCQVRDRKSIVGFLAHGVKAKQLTEKLKAGV